MSSQVRLSGAGAGARYPTEPATEAEFDRALVAIPGGMADFDKAFSAGVCDLMSPAAAGKLSERWNDGFCAGGLKKG